jgi:hypothetical protein
MLIARKACLICVVLLLGAAPVWAQALYYVDSHDGAQLVSPNDSRFATPSYAPQPVGKAGGVTFNVYYDDITSNRNVGFDDPTYGAARCARVTEIFEYISSLLDYTASCDVKFNASQTDASGALASGGTFFWQSPGLTNGLAYPHITTGNDPSATSVDISVTVDFGWQWYQGSDVCPNNQLDFKTVLLHELTHGLGFTSLMGPTGASEISTSAYSYWDKLLVTGHGHSLISGTTPSFVGSSSYLTGGDAGLFFTGAHATAAFGSNPGVYAPNPYDDGSSLAHWVMGGKITGNAVMEPQCSNGEMVREYAPVDLGALQDIGYAMKELSFTKLPAGGWFEEGANINLEVAVTGTLGEVTYQWLKDGEAIEGATDDSYVIESASDEDNGSYSCSVSDERKTTKTTTPAYIKIYPVGALPATGFMGIALGMATLLGMGVFALARRRAM